MKQSKGLFHRLKKSRAWLFALLFGSIVLLTNCQSQLDNITNLDSGTGKQAIALGDSITAGYGLTPQQAYPSLVSKKLSLPILNRGVSGDTTAMGLDRLHSDVIEEDPWLVIVGLGGNDFLRKVPKTETEQNLRKIVTSIQARGAIVVLLGMNLGLFKDEYKDLYQRVASDTGSYLIPQVLKGIIDDSRYRQEDIIHPNQAGQEILATRIAEALKSLLEKATWPPELLKFRHP